MSAVFCQMKSTVDPKDYIGVRVRIQRLSDARIFYGWVEKFDLHTIMVDTQDHVDLSSGDRCYVEISGLKTAISFQSSLGIKADTILQMNVDSQIAIRPPHEPARIRVAYEGELHSLDENLPVYVEDISASGVGFSCECELAPWTMVRLSIITPCGEILVRGQIRYCRPYGKGDKRFRAGIFIQDNESLSDYTERLMNR